MFKLLSTEPVRVYLYTITLAVFGVLVAFHAVPQDNIPPLVALAGAVFAVEGLRSKVTPTANLPDTPPDEVVPPSQ